LQKTIASVTAQIVTKNKETNPDHPKVILTFHHTDTKHAAAASLVAWNRQIYGQLQPFHKLSESLNDSAKEPNYPSFVNTADFHEISAVFCEIGALGSSDPQS